MSAGLFQHFMDGYMKFYNSPIITRTTGSHPMRGTPISEFPISGYKCGLPIRGNPSPNPTGRQFSIPVLWNLYSESVRA